MNAKLIADMRKNALSEVTNFIAQEIYKLALFRQIRKSVHAFLLWIVQCKKHSDPTMRKALMR